MQSYPHLLRSRDTRGPKHCQGKRMKSFEISSCQPVILSLCSPPRRTSADQTAERWQSGRMHRTRNAAYLQGYRGFKSHPLRHKSHTRLESVFPGSRRPLEFYRRFSKKAAMPACASSVSHVSASWVITLSMISSVIGVASERARALARAAACGEAARNSATS